MVSSPEIAVTFDRYDGERCQYRWTIAWGDGDPSFTGDDLRLGCRQEPNDVEALRALASFLGAWVEACESWCATGTKGENSGLFPQVMWIPAESYWHEIIDSLTADIGEAR